MMTAFIDTLAARIGIGTWRRTIFLLIFGMVTAIFLTAVQGSTTADSKTGHQFSLAEASAIQIVDGKIRVEGELFEVKGVAYAPWLTGTGPEPGHQPFPSEFEDVTVRVTNGHPVRVPDYSRDGRIQAWEVIRYDIEVMKAAGINTIRTYASGTWHDRNLNGTPDPGESVQGDLPDWAYDRILLYAGVNNMKVIIGYWVQEEDFSQSPPVCDNDDLEVAKQALGRVVEKYKENPAVLAWGIGNEVAGIWNHQWFSWAVPINTYLNALFDHVRTLDDSHPIIYARYVGENADFNNLYVDILAVNTYTHPAADLVDSGEFDLPAPAGKAYLLGEFGHILEQAAGHWDLARHYAGGCFLEFNNVWWKGGGQDQLGIVDAYRLVNKNRFKELTRLFGGPGLDLCDGDFDEDGDVDGRDLYFLITEPADPDLYADWFAGEFGSLVCP